MQAEPDFISFREAMILLDSSPNRLERFLARHAIPTRRVAGGRVMERNRYLEAVAKDMAAIPPEDCTEAAA